MEERNLVSSCNFRNVSPIMMELPYPALEVKEKNQQYANLLSQDYCGAVSEMSAVTQYINQESYLALERCQMAQTILGIAMAEMVHLQKLAQLILLLGGNLDFYARARDGRKRMWIPDFLSLSEDAREMLLAGIQSEREAVSQYRNHIKLIKDDNINQVLERIILDEKYHIMMLEALLEEI